MNLQDVQLFLIINKTRSLTKAARQLDISPMAVSRRLAGLEKELGIRLIQRTTRALSLTQEGAEFLPYAHALIEAEEGARALFSPNSKSITGLLRVTAPSGFGRRNIVPLVNDMLEKNPELSIHLQLSEDIVDIVDNGIDVAIRIAPLRDSSLIAKKITDNPRIVCASPAYLNKRGVPKKLKDLNQHDCLRLTNVLQWTFVSEGQNTNISIDGRFSSSNVEVIRDLCISGIGIAQLTLWDVKKELSEGSLVEINFEDAQPQNLSIWALLPTKRFLPVRVSKFIDCLINSMV
ncbi:LysR family transcriptional regulator [Acinetobacter baumannii]